MAATVEQITAIEKKILIQASRARVWRALTTAEDFAKWFSVQVNGIFAPGKRMDMISLHPCNGDPNCYLIVDKMEPEHTFSWRWHPGSASREEDGSTTVEFRLEEVDGGTLVTVVESGFDRIALARRAKTIEGNTRGWEMQLASLQKYAIEAA